MMKNIYALIALLMLSCIISTTTFAQETVFPAKIVTATKQGNAKTLSESFNSKIELVLPGKNGVFSKSQAELILDNFFKKNPAKSFAIIHKGTRDQAAYAIGKYVTEGTNYRFYFLTKSSNSNVFIHQIRIEKQND